MRKKLSNLTISNLEHLATDLRNARRGRNLSQQALSLRAEVARRTITNAENAHNIGLRELCRIANTLGYQLTLEPINNVTLEELSTIFKDDE